MKFLERFRGEDESGVRDLHRNFKIHEGPWYYNCSYSPFLDRETTLKIRFAFDDPSLLDDCPFMAKIGLNQDPAVNGKYIGFAYGQAKDQETLSSWGQKFNYTELIKGLDNEGVSTSESKVTPLKQNEKHDKV